MSRRISATLLLTATLLLLQAVPLSAHGAMVLPPPWQDVDGTYSQERGDGWMGSGVTGYQNDGVLVPDGIPEIIGEEHEGRTWCNAANRDFPGQCSFYARHPWLSPGYAVPYSPCSIFEIEPHTDARTLPGNAQPTRWASGSTVEAEWAIYANHGISLPPEAASTLPTSLLTHPLLCVPPRRWVPVSHMPTSGLWEPDGAHGGVLPGARPRFCGPDRGFAECKERADGPEIHRERHARRGGDLAAWSRVGDQPDPGLWSRRAERVSLRAARAWRVRNQGRDHHPGVS